MPILGAQLSHRWKRSHFCSPIAQDAFWCAASATQQCNSSQWANVSANNIVKHLLQRNKPSKSKLHPFPNHYSPKPSELSQAAASFQRGRSQSIISSVLCQFQETVSLMCGQPMAHVQIHNCILHTHTEHSLPKNPSASLHGHKFLLSYSGEDILIPPRQPWKENKIQQTTLHKS